MRTARTPLLALAGSLLLPFATGAQSARQTPDSAGAIAFVSEFYRWYTPKTHGKNDGPAFLIALRSRRPAFAPPLYRALEADANAQAKVKGDIVGLDFDPFLFSQDPCERYEPTGAVHRPAGFRVTVAATCDGRKDPDATVLADVELQNGTWVFANFADHEGKNDLRSTLRALAESRRSP
jgi:hypothetical protein